MKITLEVPDQISKAIRLPEVEQERRLMMELACSLYAQELLSAGKAAQLAGATRLGFAEELGRRGIPRHYTEEDLAVDLQYAGL